MWLLAFSNAPRKAIEWAHARPPNHSTHKDTPAKWRKWVYNNDGYTGSGMGVRYGDLSYSGTGAGISYGNSYSDGYSDNNGFGAGTNYGSNNGYGGGYANGEGDGYSKGYSKGTGAGDGYGDGNSSDYGIGYGKDILAITDNGGAVLTHESASDLLRAAVQRDPP